MRNANFSIDIFFSSQAQTQFYLIPGEFTLGLTSAGARDTTEVWESLFSLLLLLCAGDSGAKFFFFLGGGTKMRARARF